MAGTSGPEANQHAAAGYHGEHDEPLGPIDGRAWGMAALGALMGLLVAGALFLATAS